MLDLFYNGILCSLLVIWLAGFRRQRLARFLSFVKSHSIVLIAVLWAVFLGFGAAYCLYFDQLAQMHDIPAAVNAAVTSEENGVNPYDNNVVPRFESKYSSPPLWTYGPYNYLSFDLIVYSAFHILVGPLGMPIWFVLTNLLFSAFAFVLLQELLRVPWRFYAPFAGTVMLFYSFDNASLTLLLMVSSLYLYRRLKANNGSVAIIVMGLAVMTKIYAIIPFLVLVLYELERCARAREWHLFVRNSASVAASGVIAIALMLPFGIMHVIDSAVLFHTSASTRTGTSWGGTLLTELPLSGSEYTILSIAFVAAAMVLSLKLKNVNDRIMLVSLVFLLVVVKSSMAPLAVPGIFLPLRLRETSKPAQGEGKQALHISLRGAFARWSRKPPTTKEKNGSTL
jgi:hypothetical protein